MSPVKFVAYSQLFGGIFLLLAGLILGGSLPVISVKSICSFAYICTASIIAYTIWNTLLKTNSISKLSIIKFTEPLFAVIFSGFLLGENILRLTYLIALLLMLAALVIEHKEPKKNNS